MFDFIKDFDNYEDRKIYDKVKPEDNNGIGISTCYTSDEGFETALLDGNEIHPVERYKTQAEAVIGHQKWIEKSKTLKTVISLGGFGGCVPDKEVTLKRTTL